MNILPNIEHETYIAVPPTKLFETLTTGWGWDAWFTNGTIVDLKRRIITLRWKNFGAGRYTTEDGGPILAIEKNRMFSFQWNPSGKPTIVTFTLKGLDKGTLIKLSESGYTSDKKGVETCLGCAVGWGEALTLLKFYLEHGLTYGIVPKK